VADILQTFQRRYPYLELEEHETLTLQETLQQVGVLRDGTLDVRFLLAPFDSDALALERVLSIELVVAVPTDHPLSARTEVRMRELASEPIILFPRRFHPGCYDYIVDCCKQAGFDPNLVQKNEPQLYSGAKTYRMVASGFRVAIVARPLVSMTRRRGRLQAPPRTQPSLSIFLRHSSSISGASRSVPVRGRPLPPRPKRPPVDPAAEEIRQFGSQLLGDLLGDLGGGYQSQRHSAGHEHLLVVPFVTSTTTVLPLA